MSKRPAGLLTAAGVVAAFVGWGAPAHAATTHAAGVHSAALQAYQTTVKSFTFTNLGPMKNQTCTVVGELFVPNDATASNPQPAVLSTNGFGGKYQDQEPVANELAAGQNYVVLTYSGLGFGGSSCLIELDDPAWDGQVASDLVSWLGNQPEVQTKGPDNPRVGMIGDSYGGAVQFAAASIDPRIDALIPQITWNDLGYSLGPENNAPGLSFADSPPGVLKFEWISFFTAEGFTEPIQNQMPTQLGACPDFDPRVCPDLAASAAAGYPNQATIDLLRGDSMVSYGAHVHAPTMLMQGENDTLFNVDEAVANYNQIKANGAPVKLVVQSWGHSNNLHYAPGELTYDPSNPGYEDVLIDNWFARYLRQDASVSTGPNVEYFRDWVPYTGSAQPAYGNAPAWPVGTVAPLYLSGGTPAGGAKPGDLVTSPSTVGAGTENFANPPGGATTSYSETSAIGFEPPFSQIPPSDAPGTFAAWQTAPLTAAVDSVGIPSLHVTIDSSIPVGSSPENDPVVFAKIYDLPPTGAPVLADRIVSPTRLSTPGQPITLTLPGVVHRYNTGDRIQVVLAGSDAAYTGSRTPQVLSVAADPANPDAAVLDLPTLSAFPSPATGAGPSSAAAPPPGASPSPTATATPAGAGQQLPVTGADTGRGLGLGVGLLLIGADVFLLSRQRYRRRRA